MIESWLQVSCDGCDDDSIANADHPDLTRAEYRRDLYQRGWRSYGALDYCPRCVKRKAKHYVERTSMYAADS